MVYDLLCSPHLVFGESVLWQSPNRLTVMRPLWYILWRYFHCILLLVCSLQLQCWGSVCSLRKVWKIEVVETCFPLFWAEFHYWKSFGTVQREHWVNYFQNDGLLGSYLTKTAIFYVKMNCLIVSAWQCTLAFICISLTLSVGHLRAQLKEHPGYVKPCNCSWEKFGAEQKYQSLCFLFWSF